MAVTYEPIATQTLSSSQTSITFSSIPSTYTDLHIVIAGNEVTGNFNGVVIGVGNTVVDILGNYSTTYLHGNGTTAASSRQTARTSMGLGWNLAPDSTDLKAIYNVHLMNYSNTTTYKTAISRGNRASQAAEAVVNLWRSTSAINIIEISTSAGVGNQLTTGTIVTIYGIKAA
jgi:hypothetical protein